MFYQSVRPKPATALPAYAGQTGKACGAYHQNPAGGGPRNAFGEAFAANGHRLPEKKYAVDFFASRSERRM